MQCLSVLYCLVIRLEDWVPPNLRTESEKFRGSCASIKCPQIFFLSDTQVANIWQKLWSQWSVIKCEQIPSLFRYKFFMITDFIKDLLWIKGENIHFVNFAGKMAWNLERIINKRVHILFNSFKMSFKLRKKQNLWVVLLHNVILIMSNVIRGYQIISDKNSSSKEIKVLGTGNFTFDRSSQM